MATNDIDTPDEIAWKERASHLQTSYFTTHHDKIWWSGTPDPSNLNQLQHTIGKIMYGHGTTEEHEDLTKSGYRKSEAAKIQTIAKRIMKHFKDQTSIHAILICNNLNIKSLSTDHVFRVTDRSKDYFIDSLGRVYKTWDSLLNENKCFPCLICYPSRGLYKVDEQGEVLVDFTETPACRPLNRLIVKLDCLSGILLLIGTVLLIVSLFTDSQVVNTIALVIFSVILVYSIFKIYCYIRDFCKHS